VPIYRVYLPPLTYDANAPDPEPDPDPAHILMIREAPPLAQFQLGVAPEPTLEAARDYLPPATTPPPSPSPAAVAKPATPRAAAAPRKRSNVFARFFHVVFGRKDARCAGNGCGDAGN